MQKMMQCTRGIASDFATFYCFFKDTDDVTRYDEDDLICLECLTSQGYSYIINIISNIVSLIIRHKACPW